MCNHNNLLCSSFTRYYNISQLRVYSADKNRLLFKIRDSMDLNYKQLEDLANKFNHEMGHRGDIDPKMVSISNIAQNKDRDIMYLKHDIILLATIMQNAQLQYWRNYHIDIIYKVKIEEMPSATKLLNELYTTYNWYSFKNNYWCNYGIR